MKRRRSDFLNAFNQLTNRRRKILYLFVAPVSSKESEVMRYGYIPGYDDVHGVDRGDRRTGRCDHGVFRQ